MTHDDSAVDEHLHSLQQDRRETKIISTSDSDEDHFDERLWTYGSVIAVVIAAVAVIGGVTWVFHGDHQTASRPQTPVTETTGQRQ